jgi:hypothetical protein
MDAVRQVLLGVGGGHVRRRSRSAVPREAGDGGTRDWSVGGRSDAMDTRTRLVNEHMNDPYKQVQALSKRTFRYENGKCREVWGNTSVSKKKPQFPRFPSCIHNTDPNRVQALAYASIND